ncbi:GtrA family protein [Mesorhizobium sp. BAC0120]|uniref:GtrA family protein n=1 Tax=Mesorhizobium sp. BAC0120 TaxID=3090670 RepID=UPI00298D4B22|nr:GtrA family protein [Mesorhizobium sp. BAC0120]MDW6020958.1 GtrA family protein [Mesorhizobium sp. BAC0120]
MGVIRKQAETFLRFVTVGLLTATIYALVLAVIAQGTGKPALGAAVAYVLAVAFNYWAHYAWTYQTDRPHKSAGARYMILAGLMFCINVAATASVPKVFNVSFVVVQGALAVLIIGVSFVVQGLWVYRDR